jgi:hypothetical protein
MYRVKKAKGWNKYKVQKRFMCFFWRDAEGNKTYCGRGLAEIRAIELIGKLQKAD